MKKYITIVLFVLIGNHSFSQNAALLVDKEWEIREYITDVYGQITVLFNSDSTNNSNDLKNRSFKFITNGSYDEINDGTIDYSGNWLLNAPQDSLTIKNSKYEIAVLTEDSLVLQTSGKNYGIEVTGLLKLTEKRTLSSGELNVPNLVEIYPNPTDGIVNFKLKNKISTLLKKVEVVSVLGEKVLSINFENKAQESLSLQSIANGLYFIQFRDKNNKLIVTKKVMLIK